jgi:hypothetical protein
MGEPRLTPGRTLAAAASDSTRQEGGTPAMDDFVKFLMFVGALVGAYHSGRTAWRLGTELFG